jgi:hypothetical protein
VGLFNTECLAIFWMNWIDACVQALLRTIGPAVGDFLCGLSSVTRRAQFGDEKDRCTARFFF